jgi:hypothetical protein
MRGAVAAFKARITKKTNYCLVAAYKYSYERVKIVFNLVTFTVIHLSPSSEKNPLHTYTQLDLQGRCYILGV